VNYGDDAAAAAIADAWRAGNEVDGWSRCWAATYRHVLGQIDQHREVRDACLLFRHEDLCGDSPQVIDRILEHCGLPADPFTATRARYIEKLSLPEYYRPAFEPAELAQIERHCAEIRDRLYALCAS
jgi:hypothetical protein